MTTNKEKAMSTTDAYSNDSNPERSSSDRLTGQSSNVGHSESAVVDGFLRDVQREVVRAQAKWPGMNSAHEAYAVILEEVDEFWAEVRKKATEYDLRAMYDELVQIAAMAARAVDDIIAPAVDAAAAQGQNERGAAQ